MSSRSNASDPLASLMEIIGRDIPTEEFKKDLLAEVKKDQQHRFRIDWFRHIMMLINTLLAVALFVYIIFTSSEMAKNPDVAAQAWKILTAGAAFCTVLAGGTAMTHYLKRA